MKITVTIQHQNGETRLDYTTPVRLAQALADAGLTQPHPCGGHGTCGKCTVRVTGELSPMSETERQALASAGHRTDGELRLSCLSDAIGDVTLNYSTTKPSLQGLLAGFSRDFLLDPPQMGNGIGMAVDIGTTTVAAYLYDLKNGNRIAERCVENPQKAHGADVISRIGYALTGGGEQLSGEMQDCLSALAKDLSAEAGVDLPKTTVVVGNTAMLHLLTNTDPSPLAAAPFIVKRAFGEWEDGRYYPPCISAYVGADMTAAILDSGMCQHPDQTALLLDVGTNGEMALWHDGRLLCCSTAAGPAFEGAGISCGSLAVPGAICRVSVQDGKMNCETIDDQPATGLCGTGLIDAVAALLEMGILEDSGFMEDDAPLGESGLSLTRADIRQVQLAKAAIRAGIDTLLHEAGIAYEQLDAVYLAGGFGSYLHPDTCAAIGMIPRELIDKIKVLGNAAGQGASLMLLSKAELRSAEEIARRAQTIELSASAVFMEKYVDSMMF
ncbi:MAG: DUF4445 domain-containing protein [Ruminococcaceae bacterium]|nr:DUF4445 domain-containing protein [Oscillospiraceae bacterium]MBE6676207.1 DUF4445 domain-containing protein [Oscillospiraceae bacterium]